MSYEQFLRIDALCERVGIGRAQVYVAMKDSGFPKPVKIFGKRASAWVASEVDAWIRARIAERDAAQGR